MTIRTLKTPTLTERGTTPGSAPTIKPLGDGRSGVWEYINDDATGYLFHLLSGVNTGSGAAMIGIGTDRGAATGLLVSQKSDGVGIQVTGNPSSTAPPLVLSAYSQAAAAYPLQINNYAGSKASRIQVQLGAGYPDGVTTNGSTIFTSATAAFVAGDVGQTVTQLTSRGEGFRIPSGATIASVTNGTTAVLSAPATGTATGINFRIGARVPAANLPLWQMIDYDGTALASWTRAQSAMYKPMEVLSTTAANPNTQFFNGSDLRFYSYFATGSNYAAHYLQASTLTFRIRSYATAAKGSESAFTDMLQVKKDALGFFGTAPIARPAGWGIATGTATRTTFDTTTVTLPQLAEHVKALIDDLHATAGYGLLA